MQQSFSAPNNFASAARLIGDVMGFLSQGGLNTRALFLAELVLEELLTNTVKYGFDDPGPHQLAVDACVLNGWVSLDFMDEGHAFDPTQGTDPQANVPALERKPGGRGLQLLRNLSIRLTYERRDRTNHVRVIFPVEAAEAA